MVVNADGTPRHPERADIERLGARVETNPTDDFVAQPLARMSAARVNGGVVYSRIDCHGFDCIFMAGFVPMAEALVARRCGVAPLFLRIVGVSERGLGAARQAIRFRWAAKASLPLSQLGAGPVPQSGRRSGEGALGPFGG